ncbi:MAG TPA: relaxase/mobilization nuclease domain-containing protein [Nitrosomonas sp.]|nr:relaxase/mobilization nuclease domain-containing protein [Nitrosomonas sp.]HRB78423.1 relaxase/mobilization nuclease domain-containing protein [Nitrosomonas sp.]
MIAKHIPIKKANKNNFSRLINYLVKESRVGERVGRIVVSNCYADEVISGTMEIEHTQGKNIRAQADKTYHLVISFESEQKPEDYVLDDIEQELCKALGLEEHQRISVSHIDTEHFHIHLAINKIHPQKLIIHEPYRDFWKLGRICEMLEIRHGLAVTNHQTKNPGIQSKAADIDHHAQLQSLQSYIRSNVLVPLQMADDWHSFHQVLKNYGLEILERGNGFAFKTIVDDGRDIVIKASSVDRSLSKQKLTKRLGQFEISVDENVKVKRRYQRKPGDVSKAALYEKYKKERSLIVEARTHGLNKLKQERTEQLRSRKNYFNTKIKFMKASFKFLKPLAKRLMYASLYSDYKSDIDEINKQYSRQKNELNLSYRLTGWKEWQQRKGLTSKSTKLVVFGMSAPLHHKNSRPKKNTKGMTL